MSGGLGETLLVREEGRALDEKDGKGGHADIGHRIARVLSSALIGQAGASLTQLANQSVQNLHAKHESQGKSPKSPTMPSYSVAPPRARVRIMRIAEPATYRHIYSINFGCLTSEMTFPSGKTLERANSKKDCRCLKPD
jgi:hypothetical protein